MLPVFISRPDDGSKLSRNVQPPKKPNTFVLCAD